MNTELKNAITLMINEEIVKAKQLIEDNLYAKLGKALEEKLMEYAPTVFNEKKEDEDEEEDEEDDSEDSEDEDDNDDEESDAENDSSEEMNEQFEYELYSTISDLVDYIQEQEGKQLTQEEIEFIAEEVIREYELLAEEQQLDPVGEEDGDVDNDNDEDESDAYLAKRRAAIAAAINRGN
jgi:X-linked retinitis pigmentosa GTPase regulator